MKILIVFTGGTIGCPAPDENNILKPSAKNRYLLKDHMEKGIDFDILDPLTVLSENMTADNWMTMIKSLQNVNLEQYDGIIITHGSDTLAYFSAFLGICMSGISIPAVIIAAGKNLYDPGTNGFQNFSAAVDFIKNTSYTGVFTAFASGKTQTEIYISTRLMQWHPFALGFESNNGILGFMKNGEFYPKIDIKPIIREPILYKLKNLSPLVEIIYPYVGLDYSKINPGREKTRAIIHGTYHSFTVNSGIKILEQKCVENGILLCLAPFSESVVKYESSKALDAGNIITMNGHTLECAYAKILIAVNLYNNESDIKKFIKQIFFYEEVENYI